MKFDPTIPARWSRGASRGRYLKRRSPVAAVVVHTTGAGPLRVAKRRNMRPLDAAVWIYQNRTDAGPHFVVDQQGDVVQTCPLDLCAWGVGSRGAAAYLNRDWGDGRHVWWRARFPGLASPLELAGGDLWTPYKPAANWRERLRRAYRAGRRLSCNANVVHVEVVPPEGAPRGQWSRLAEERVADLVERLASVHRFPLVRTRVLSHAEAHPLARTTKRGLPWDPWPRQWPLTLENAPWRSGCVS